MQDTTDWLGWCIQQCYINCLLSSITMYIHGYACIYIYVLVYKNTCLNIYVYTKTHMYIHACLGIYQDMHVYTCVPCYVYMVYTCMFHFAKSCPCGQDSRCIQVSTRFLRFGTRRYAVNLIVVQKFWLLCN